MGEVATITMGQAPAGNSYNASGEGVPLIAGAGDFNNGRIKVGKSTTAPTKFSAPGDIVLSIRASIGAKVWSDGIYCLGRGVAGIKANAELSADYLWHWLGASEQTLTSKGRGATFLQVNRDDISEMKIPLPPLDEQRRIASILDQAETLRNQRRAQLAHLNALPQAIFHQMFGQSEGSYPRVTLDQIATVKGGKRVPKGESYAEGHTDHPYIRVSDIHPGIIMTSDLKYLTSEIHSKISRYTVNAGDVVITIAGTIGVTAPVPMQLNGANLTENAARIVALESDSYIPNWLSYTLQSKELQQQIRARTGQVTIGKLALFRIEQLELMLPPIESQLEFERKLTVLASRRKPIEAAANEATALFASLQARAFRGEL